MPLLVAAAPAGAPLVDSGKLQRLLSREGLEARAKELYAIAKRNNGTRAFDTAGSRETLNWIESNIPKDYFNIQRQYFNYTGLIDDEISITVDGVAQKEVGKVWLNGNGTVTAPVVLVPNFGCNATDYTTNIDVSRKIVLVTRGGDCAVGDRMILAGGAGATGLILWDTDLELLKDISGAYSTTWAAPPSGSSFDPRNFIVSTVIGYTEGQALVDKYQLKESPFSKGNVTVTNRYHEQVFNIANIIATTKGGNQDAIINFGAHTDSVREGPGINDNGSGMIAQIEVAKALSQFSINNAIQFCFWNGEEEGLLGSTYYTEHLSDSDAAKIVMNVDFDMLASPNYIYGVYKSVDFPFKTDAAKAGSDMIAQTLFDFLKDDAKMPSISTKLDGRSDYAGFLERGIPASGLFSGAEANKTEEEAKLFGGKAGEPYDACYHQACDTIDNLNYEAFLIGARSIAYTVAKYGQSIEGFPFPRPVNKALGA
ncbi:Leucyl aminopeptidase yscIV [Orbilia ellipsospora]|uniref:Peptide hydrolase n=1 Tax=Orbilia ellipsospora TaxID=2528407 RepID=A0AAV9X938_9PEZI